MSCCQRTVVGRAADVRWTAVATPPVASPQAPLRIRFVGPRALSLPAGSRRVLALPEQEVEGLNQAERLALWRTGLFEALE